MKYFPITLDYGYNHSLYGGMLPPGSARLNMVTNPYQFSTNRHFRFFISLTAGKGTLLRGAAFTSFRKNANKQVYCVFV